MIKIICYGRTEEWESREEAIEYFGQAAMCTEGSERERYMNIYFDLLDGKEICIDEAT